jgi:elongation factor Ts
MQISASMVKELRERTGAGMMECKKALVEAAGNVEQAAENLRKAGQAKADKKAGRVAAEGVIAVQVSGDTAALVEVNCETDFVAKQDEFQAFAAAVAEKAATTGVSDVAELGGQSLDGEQSIDDRLRDLVATIGEKISLRRAVVHQLTGERFGVYVHGARIGVVVDVSGGGEDLARDLAMHVAASNPLALDEGGLPPETLDKEKEILRAQIADSGKPPEIQEKMLTGRVAKYLKEVTLLGQPFVKEPDVSVAKLLQRSSAGVKAFTRLEVGEGIEKKTENFAEEVMAQVRGH